MAHHNKYISIIPSEMNNNELRNMCTELQIAINWGQDFATINLPSGNYNNPVSRLADYQEAFQTETGQIRSNFN